MSGIPRIPNDDQIEQQVNLAPEELDEKDQEIASLLEKISKLQAPPVAIKPNMSLRDDGFDDQNIDLLQLAHASYVREINKYNTIFN